MNKITRWKVGYCTISEQLPNETEFNSLYKDKVRNTSNCMSEKLPNETEFNSLNKDRVGYMQFYISLPNL